MMGRVAWWHETLLFVGAVVNSRMCIANLSVHVYEFLVLGQQNVQVSTVPGSNNNHTRWGAQACVPMARPDMFEIGSKCFGRPPLACLFVGSGASRHPSQKLDQETLVWCLHRCASTAHADEGKPRVEQVCAEYLLTSEQYGSYGDVTVPIYPL